MPQEVRLWRVAGDDSLNRISRTTLDYEERLENWLEEDISILDPNLLVIGRQVETDFGGAIDLLCMDRAGDLVVLELKKDRTSRQVTSQALEYASWVQDLGSKRVTELADEYLSSDAGLQTAFEDRFGESLPEVLNESHRLLVVAAELDAGSERIIEYLSGEYGVNINAVNFQLFRTSADEELLGRVFLVEPSEVDYRARTRQSSKRRAYPTREELQQRADEAGVGDLYRGLVDLFGEIFPSTETRMESLAFHGRWQRLKSEYSVFLNLYPDRGDADQGVDFEFYTYRAADAWGLEDEEVRRALPEDVDQWRYSDTDDEDQQWRWEGHTGTFRSIDNATSLVELLQNTKPENRGT